MSDEVMFKETDVVSAIQACSNVTESSGFQTFFKNFIHYPHPTLGSIAVKDSIYKWQNDASIEFLKNRFLISAKSRQVGFSAFTSSYALWRALFFENQNIFIISIGQRESSDFLERIIFQYDKLPVWLKSETKEFAKTSITFKNGSRIRSLPNGPNVVRGQTASLIILDEFAFYKPNAVRGLMSSAVPAISAGLTTEFKQGQMPSQLFVISTLPEMVEGNEYMRLLLQAKDNPVDSEYQIIEVVTDDIPMYQDPDWHKQMLESLGQRRYDIEIKNIIPNSLENGFMPDYILNMIKPQMPIRTEFLEEDQVTSEGYYKDFDKMEVMADGYDKTYGYIQGLQIYQEKIDGQKYGAVVDPAAGKSRDYSVIIIFNLETHEQVAEIRSNVMDLPTFQELIETVIEYYDQPKLSIESNGLGAQICDYFGNHVAYENFYWSKKTKSKYEPGFYLSGPIRSNALAMMQTLIRNEEIKINSDRLLTELKFLEIRNGRIQAANHYHDDLAMALAQYCYLVNTGFFASEKVIEENLIYGKFLTEEREKEESGKRENHYLTKQMEEAMIMANPKAKEVLDIIKSSGGAVNMLEFEKMMEEFRQENPFGSEFF